MEIEGEVDEKVAVFFFCVSRCGHGVFTVFVLSRRLLRAVFAYHTRDRFRRSVGSYLQEEAQ